MNRTVLMPEETSVPADEVFKVKEAYKEIFAAWGLLIQDAEVENRYILTVRNPHSKNFNHELWIPKDMVDIQMLGHKHRFTDVATKHDEMQFQEKKNFLYELRMYINDHHNIYQQHFKDGDLFIVIGDHLYAEVLDRVEMSRSFQRQFRTIHGVRQILMKWFGEEKDVAAGQRINGQSSFDGPDYIG